MSIETLKVVGLSGALSTLSRTTTLVQSYLDSFASHGVSQLSLLSIAELAPYLAQTTDPTALPPALQQAVAQLSAADIIVVASPVYKGSYTGLFKHFIDLLDPQLLKGKTVLLAATGGTELHALVLEHQLRPLFSFFGALTVPATVFLKDSSLVKVADGSSYQYQLAAPLERIALSVSQALHLHAGPPPLQHAVNAA
ncbi:NAD(P)H-dependent oxidoreductase [Rheinheimera muenzenbergensis]|uniref:NAD(P)H-dependent oxidoreductase n=1 Tax=Rheinheimera muenzenbergensis TaxID=1193628 RepID=A0ABU8C3T3_9GAMM